MSKQTDTVVIGAGPGGYVAAIRAAQLGQKVTIIEAEHIGGVCLNVGCIPSKALITAGHRYQEAQHSEFLGVTAPDVAIDFAKTQQWKDQQVVKTLTNGIGALLRKNKVTIIEGFARFKDKNTLTIKTAKGEENLSFKNAIIATGGRPIQLPDLPFSTRIVDSTGGLNLKEIPEHLAIIGAGVIGCELAGAYANMGAKVTLIEGSPSILPMNEADIQEIVKKKFQEKGVRIVANARAKRAFEVDGQVHLDFSVGDRTERLTSDYLMITVGRRPNTDTIGLESLGLTTDKKGLIPINERYQTKLKHIYAIGDVIAGPALAHKASYEAKVAAEVIAGKNVQKDYRALPAICFTDPEVATVGLTKKEAEVEGIKVAVANFPMQANGRALSLNETEGFVRLVFEKETELIVGAQIVGPNASDLIAEVTTAIESYLTLEDIALTIHGHPTLSETIMDASEVGLGLPIHM